MSDICSRLCNLPIHFEPFVTQFSLVGLSDFARPWLGSCVINFFSQLIVSVALVKAFQFVALLLKMYVTSDFHWVSESSSSLFSFSNAWIMASLLLPH